MLSKIKKSNNSEGFTIIEVMIVLAIAALILLIVLLAVPALQRSANNTSRKNDASAIEGAVSNGEIGATASGALTVGGTSTGTITEQANLGYYKTFKTANTALGTTNMGDIYINTTWNAPSPPALGAIPVNTGATANTTTVTTSNLVIVPGVGCNGLATSLSSYQIDPQEVSVIYATDNGSGSGTGTLQCVET
jgi:prepilin-type N-terminal cleavage/methylation domain-containing protein